MDEQIKEILENANKILNELENLEKSKFKSELYEKTKRSLLDHLIQLSENLVSIFPATLTGEELEYATRGRKLTQKTLKEIKRRIKRRKEERKKARKEIEIRMPNPYVTISNLWFRKLSRRFVSKPFLKNLSVDIRRANLNILADSFIAVVIMNVLVSFIFGIIVAAIFAFMKIQFTPVPLMTFTSFNISRFLYGGLIIIPLFVLTTFLLSFYYPKLEAMSRANQINDEIPFAAMHMSAIVGSGVEPARVFKLISDTDEYKHFRVEAKRIVNKINFYGYDLLTAIKETASITPSAKARDLFNGMSSIIATGGDLRSYLEKKATALMVDYKLRRERFTAAAGIYADIYTGLLITAPIVFGVLLTLIAPMGIDIFGMDVKSLSIIGLVVISLFNAAFVVLLNVLQPPE